MGVLDALSHSASDSRTGFVHRPVADVPSQGTELPPLLNHRMEELQASTGSDSATEGPPGLGDME